MVFRSPPTNMGYHNFYCIRKILLKSNFFSINKLLLKKRAEITKIDLKYQNMKFNKNK